MALEILAYATRKNNMEMANMAAQHTRALSPQQVYGALEPQAFLNWVCRSFYAAKGLGYRS
jgi:hypothetical protein